VRSAHSRIPLLFYVSTREASTRLLEMETIDEMFMQSASKQELRKRPDFNSSNVTTYPRYVSDGGLKARILRSARELIAKTVGATLDNANQKTGGRLQQLTFKHHERRASSVSCISEPRAVWKRIPNGTRAFSEK